MFRWRIPEGRADLLFPVVLARSWLAPFVGDYVSLTKGLSADFWETLGLIQREVIESVFVALLVDLNLIIY
jgi:hypothetical protein